MDSFGCRQLIARYAPSTLRFCHDNGVSLSVIPGSMTLYDGIDLSFEGDVVTFSFDNGGKIIKTEELCDIINPYAANLIQVSGSSDRVRFKVGGKG
jgi:hypothetical protein